MQPHDHRTSRNYVVIEGNRPCFYHTHEGRMTIIAIWRTLIVKRTKDNVPAYYLKVQIDRSDIEFSAGSHHWCYCFCFRQEID